MGILSTVVCGKMEIVGEMRLFCWGFLWGFDFDLEGEEDFRRAAMRDDLPTFVWPAKDISQNAINGVGRTWGW